jgi:hypothetical protein
MVSWRRRINCIFKKRNAVAWALDQRRMNQNAIDTAVWAHDQRQIDAAVWSYDQRYIQTKFIERRL